MKAIATILICLAAVATMGQGFYKAEADPQGNYVTLNTADTSHYSISHAVNGVDGGKWQLTVKDKDTYDYPVHGWWWADSKARAVELLNLRAIKTEE